MCLRADRSRVWDVWDHADRERDRDCLSHQVWAYPGCLCLFVVWSTSHREVYPTNSHPDSHKLRNNNVSTKAKSMLLVQVTTMRRRMCSLHLGSWLKFPRNTGKLSPVRSHPPSAHVTTTTRRSRLPAGSFPISQRRNVALGRLRQLAPSLRTQGR